MINTYRMYLVVLAALIILSGIFLFAAFHSGVQKIPLKNIENSWHALGPTTPEIVHGDTSKKQVIFTFDAGATDQSAGTVLTVLKKHHIRGTFFLTGMFVKEYPALVREIATGGNEIFNHTYDHPHLTQISDGHIIWELDALDQALKLVLASSTPEYSTRPYFRAPYGDRDSRVLAAAARDGYRSVYWTFDADDWEESTGMTAAQVEDKILSKLAPGNIYLMHLGDNITGSILDDVFTKIEGEGYKIVSLTEGL